MRAEFGGDRGGTSLDNDRSDSSGGDRRDSGVGTRRDSGRLESLVTN